MSNRRNRSILAVGILALAACATGCTSSSQAHSGSPGFFGQIAAGDPLGISLGARESTPKAVAESTRTKSQPSVANAATD